MNDSQFWQIIEDTGAQLKSSETAQDFLSSNLEDELVKLLRKRLDQSSVEEIAAFRKTLELKKKDLYRNDLWAIAYIIHGGCSNDYFDEFRSWVVFQGKNFFERVLANPEIIGHLAEPGMDLRFIHLASLPVEMYEEKTGRDYGPYVIYTRNDPPAGASWHENDLEQLYPKLCEKFRL